MSLLSSLRWWWRLRRLPSEEDLTHWENNRFIADVRWKLAMAKHRDYLDMLSRYRP